MSPHVLDRLSAHLDGELPREEEAAVREHLAGCAECRLRLEELAVLDAAARALPSATPPAGYFEALPARVRTRLEGRSRVWHLPVWSLAAAAALALMVLTPVALRRANAPVGMAPPAQAPVPLPEGPPKEPSVGSLELRDKGSWRREDAQGPAAAHRLPKSLAPVAPQAAATPAPESPVLERTPLRREEAAARSAPELPMAAQPSAAPAVAAPVAGALATNHAARKGAAETDRPREAGADLKVTGKQAPLAGEGSQAGAGALLDLRESGSEADAGYARLVARGSPATAASARALRDAWQAFARDHASHAGADEARVRALETGALAYRLSLDPRDLERLRADAAAYLARTDAAQTERVRALLEQLRS